jgi:hypothetical protein
MNKMLAAYNDVADHFYENNPGVLAFINAIDAKDKNMVNDLQIFKNMDAFLGHADRKNPTNMSLLMNWAQHWQEGGLSGQVYCDDPDTIGKMTAAIGAKFEFFKWPASSGKVNMQNGEFNLGQFEANYFPLHGRVEPLVLMSHYMGLPLDRTVKADWPAGAENLEFRGLPQVSWKGK